MGHDAIGIIFEGDVYVYMALAACIASVVYTVRVAWIMWDIAKGIGDRWD